VAKPNPLTSLYSAVPARRYRAIANSTPDMDFIISNSSSVIFVTEVEPGGEKPVSAPWIIRVSTERAPNCPVIAVWRPWPRDMSETTAAIPMNTPSIVSQERIPLFLTFLNARIK